MAAQRGIEIQPFDALRATSSRRVIALAASEKKRFRSSRETIGELLRHHCVQPACRASGA
jgi:hypothetical protein